MKHRFFMPYVVSAGRLMQHERSKRIGDDLYGFLPLDLYGSRGDTDEFVSWLDAYRVADWFGEHTPDEKAEEAISPPQGEGERQPGAGAYRNEEIILLWGKRAYAANEDQERL